MATHSSVLAWRIPGMGEPGGLPSMGSQSWTQLKRLSSSSSIYRSFVSLGRFIPKYFILFIAMVNGIVPLISCFVFLLLVYRNARDFSVLILYPVTLLYSLLTLVIFWWCLYGFLCRGSCPLQPVRILLLFQSGFLLFLFLL